MERVGVAPSGTPQQLAYDPHTALVTFSGQNATREQFHFASVNTLADVRAFISAGCPSTGDGSQTCINATAQGAAWNDDHENLYS